MRHSKDAKEFDADVAIVGAGPVGVLLAILLADYGKSVVLIERWTDHYALPRAVTYDHEIARILAAIDIDSEADGAVGFSEGKYYWRNRDGEDLQVIDWKSEFVSGWRSRYYFHQPLLESKLIQIASDRKEIAIVRGWQAIGLEQNEDGVSLSLEQNPEEYRTSRLNSKIRAKFVVGADGANSFVREALGFEVEDKGYCFDWLILDVIPSFDYPASRPNEPAQWQLCDPKRPTTIVSGGPGPTPGDPNRRRWEFMVLPGEVPEVLQETENAWRLLEPWGVTPDNSLLERSAVYRFQAKWAKQWHKGRCVLAGDAAHLMPPFAGQGMCSGLRDALALSWRLNAILDGQCGTQLLDSYTTERLENTKYFIELSESLGRIICVTDEEEAAARDARLIADLKARGGKPLAGENTRIGPGAWCSKGRHAGVLSLQGRVAYNGQVDRFDQAVGRGWILLGYETDPDAALTDAQRAQLAQLQGVALTIGPPDSEAQIIDIDGFYARWLSDIDSKFLLMRPDFYVATSAKTPQELQTRFSDVASTLDLMRATHEAVR